MKQYMVVERFKPGCADAIYERFERCARRYLCRHSEGEE